jgi:UDP-N-acetylmuramoyl-L-alanyl-D-glutamate--2,6-diaminopimelate ligase
MEAYGSAKARLMAMLPESGTAIVNVQDPAHERMLRGCRARVIRCAVAGSGEPAPGGDTALAEVLESGIDGMRLRLTGPWGQVECAVPLIGRYNAMNMVQAIACCHAIGIPTDEIQRAMPDVCAPPGRLEPVRVKGVAGPRVYVDYAHSDDSLRSVLTAVRGAMRDDPSAGRLWVVFGCGGDRDRTKRPRMGLAAAEIADVAIVTSDNPRSEQPGAIVKEILSGVPAELRGKVDVHIEREHAIEFAILHAAENDVVVVAGKGHETEQIKLDSRGQMVTLHFDDREHSAAALRKRSPRSEL